MRGLVPWVLATLWVSASEAGHAQNVDHFDTVREFEQPPPLTSDRFRYGGTWEETVAVTVPRRDKPVPVVIWFPWPAIDMATRQDTRWMRSFLYDQGVATARIDVTNKAGRTLPALIQSCERALAEIVRQAPRRGYDPDRIILAGSGWGSYLATLFSVEPSHTTAAGLPFRSIRGVLLIEPAGLDLQREQKLASRYVGKQLTKLTMGVDELSAVSPAAHLAPPNVPAALILASDSKGGRAALDAQIAEDLRSTGMSVTFQTLDRPSGDDARTMVGAPGHRENQLIKNFLNLTVR